MSHQLSREQRLRAPQLPAVRIRDAARHTVDALAGAVDAAAVGIGVG